LLEYLKSFSGINYYIYPFPTGRLYIFGDKISLKLVLFGYEIEEEEGIVKNFNNSIAGEIGVAVEYLDRFLLGEEGGAPNFDLESFTHKEIAVYRELINVPFGETICYGDLAKRAGIRKGARFVGNAMAKNRFPILIPCHRVIKASGDIGNYSSGRAIKRFLLEHERVICEERYTNG